MFYFLAIPPPFIFYQRFEKFSGYGGHFFMEFVTERLKKNSEKFRNILFPFTQGSNLYAECAEYGIQILPECFLISETLIRSRSEYAEFGFDKARFPCAFEPGFLENVDELLLVFRRQLMHVFQ